MLKQFTRLCMTAAFSLSATIALADGHAGATWILDAASSKVAFGSIKKNTAGEAHHFSGLTGSVTADGAASVEIDLTSVETWIDIRNERMLEHVFKEATTATLTGALDMDALNALAVGESTVLDLEGNLALLGTDTAIEAAMFVIRIADDRVLATTDEMIFVGTEALGLTAGIDKLMELAKLPGITRTSPVTLRFMFVSDAKQAAAAPAAAENTQVAAVATVGDVKNGQKVFRKCRACHKLDAGKNGVGPTLHQIMGRPAGAIEGFRYSDALANSGITWGVEELTGFLTKPKDYLPGNKMSFAGLKKEDDITDVIAYLTQETQ